MPTLNFQCNLDRLGPNYEAGKPYYLLTLSTAFADNSGTATDVLNMLQPWLWTFKDLVVYKQASSGGAWSQLDHRIVPAATPSGLGSVKDALTSELQAQLADFQAADFAWAQPAGSWSGRKGRLWRSWLAHVGSYPGGIGTALNLAFVFVPTTPPSAGDILMAAPSITVNGTDFAPVDPNDSSQPLRPSGQTGLYQWAYNNGALAFVNIPDTPVADPQAYINVETLWRNDLALDGGGDWTQGLEDRLGVAFDGVERLLEWLRQAVTKVKGIPASFNDFVLRALFEIVRGSVDSNRRPIRGEAIWQIPARVDPTLPPIGKNATVPANWVTMIQNSRLNLASKSFQPAFPPDPAVPEIFRDDWTSAQSLFQRDAMLIEVVMALWSSIFGTQLTADLNKALRVELGKLSLRRALLAEAASDTWRALVPQGGAAGKEFATATKSVTDALTAFGATIWPTGDADWTTVLEVQAAQAMRDPKTIASDSTSDGILIQVDKVEVNDRNDTQKDSSDYLRKISGVGVLMRGPSGLWRCLNMADIQIRQVEKDYSTIDTSPKAVPRRFTYEGELRQGFVLYLNQPLVARSPWSDLSPSRSMGPADTDVVGTGLVQYASPYKATASWKLERLIYGNTYDVAVFYFGNGGALPLELAAQDSASGKIPWQFQLPSGGTNLRGSKSVTFLRNCPVGQVRIEAVHTFPPALPDGVHPIARAIEQDSDKTHPLLVLLPSNAAGWDLSAGQQSYTFSVRPPNLDVKVWDRWIPDDAAGSTTNKDRRKKVLGQVHELRYALDTGQIKQADATIDDPAIAGFTVVGERLWGGNTPFDGGIQITFSAKAVGDLSGEQKDGIPLLVKSIPAAAPKLEKATGPGYTLSVPDGELWRFDLTPTLDIKASGRLSATVSQNVPPLSFIVEVTQPLAITGAVSKALYQGLTFTPLADSLNVGLDPAQFTDFAPLVHRVELITQRWRWDGRPVFENPGPQNPPAPPESGVPFTKLGLLDDSDNDGMLFANREDSDANLIPTQVDFVVPDGKMASPAVLRQIGWSDKPGLLYYRFAVRVFSRYEGLLDAVAAADSSTPETTKDPRRWRRYARECRWSDRVPKPLVKLVLPLTQSVDAFAGTPAAAGWLVVVDEPWYRDAMAGLGEMLVSEIVAVKGPELTDETRPQFGPDPIIDMTADPWAGWTIVAPKPVGAIGSTFDTDPVAPLFVRSAFVQPPPVLYPAEGTPPPAVPPDLSFYLVKLRFKRVIGGIDPDKPQSDRVLESEFTDGYWTQLLPPSEWWSVKEANGRVRVTDLSFSATSGFQWKNGTATLLSTGPQPEPANSMCRFQLFGLVTKKVTDAFGRAGQEAFVGIGTLDQLSTMAKVHNARIRLVEIQFRLASSGQLPAIQNLDQFVQTLFPKAGIDAIARVVRVSAPFDVQ